MAQDALATLLSNIAGMHWACDETHLNWMGMVSFFAARLPPLRTVCV